MKKERFIIELAIIAAIVMSIVLLASRDKATTTETLPPEPPVMTELMTTVLEQSDGFEYLVSYTDDGFHPNTLTVKRGETVRFTNNSSGELLWVAATPGESGIYPRGSVENCGQSAFDSCVGMHPREFWEFTFDAEGEWNFANNGNTAHTGTVTVTSQ